MIGAIAILAAHFAQDLGQMVVAQFAAGAAWGAILMSAFTVAFAIGENGGEGRMSGLLFSALALATLTRMATVATGFNADPALKSGAAMGADTMLGVAGAALIYLAAARVKRWVRSLGRHRGVRKTGGVERAPYKAGCFRDFEQFACNLQRDRPSFRHRYRDTGLLEIARQHARAGQFRQQSRERVMRKSESVALPLPRHLSHLIDARYFLNTGVRRRAARAARSRRVGDGNNPAARPIDLFDGFNGRARWHQVGTFDEIIGWTEIDAFRALGVLRHECNVTFAFRDRVGDLTRIIVDLQGPAAASVRLQNPEQIDSNAFDVAFAVLDGKKGGSRRRGHDAAAKFS